MVLSEIVSETKKIALLESNPAVAEGGSTDRKAELRDEDYAKRK